MKPIFLREFEALVAESSTIVTSHTDNCPGVVVAKEAALQMARSAVQCGHTLRVEVWQLTTQPQILLGSPTGRQVVA